MFWQEKMTRQINDCSSIAELREMAVLLTKIATTRQVAAVASGASAAATTATIG